MGKQWFRLVWIFLLGLVSFWVLIIIYVKYFFSLAVNLSEECIVRYKFNRIQHVVKFAKVTYQEIKWDTGLRMKDQGQGFMWLHDSRIFDSPFSHYFRTNIGIIQNLTSI